MKLHPALNRAWIASQIGVSKQFISRIENGHAKMPADKLIKLNEVLREISRQLSICCPFTHRETVENCKENE